KPPSGWVLAPRSIILARPRSSANMPRSRHSRTMEPETLILAASRRLATPVTTRSRRCNGQRPLVLQAEKNACSRTGASSFTPSGRARFIAIEEPVLAEAPDAAFPFLLNTGRVRDQWHTMTRTGLSPKLASHTPNPFV